MTRGNKVILYVTGALGTLFLGFLAYNIFTSNKDKAPARVDGSPLKLLFIGDSLTAYPNSYVDQLKSKHPNWDIKKIAVSGKQTAWMLPQLKQELANGKKYDIIAIWGGVNDIYATNSISKAKNNLQEMYDISKNSGARKVISLTTIPTATYKISDNNKTKLTNDLNSWIKSNKTIDGIVDVNYLVNNGSNGTKPEYLQSDTLHLTDKAHSVIQQDFYNKILS